MREWGRERVNSSEEVGEEEDKAEDVVDEESEQRASRSRERAAKMEEYRTGYDATGETRVGIGTAKGDIERLVRQNEGRHRSDGEHSVREAARDKTRLTEAFCSAMGVTSFQQRRAMAAIATMNLDRFGRQKRLANVALATIRVIVERDRFRRYQEMDDLASLSADEGPRRVTDEEAFCELLGTYSVSRSDLISTSQLVKRELKREGFFTGARTADADGESV
ncbi:DNA-directed RNA polymerase subunit epsilon [Halorubellus sp. JP-L1]|uniref:DNA-directed RNA polymerase subunit epsilon n=1 Tax=Halorubellus sp. JP-L1 TaxID=2715753 RepID=UPI001407CEAB|nr:DNA-directed RNA polymerase subunit epsilon [Halorubellus sp. JP-L1]NHN41831.1 DNA-directed RNA polymerase subunit epsilon [Halorubellus sp. JP-L1]